MPLSSSRGIQSTKSSVSQARSSTPDFQTLLHFKNLEMRARIVVEGFMSGLHRSPYHGFSVEFTDYRQYSPGDDPRFLDWKLLARTDRAFIKRFEDETNLRCTLLVDQSRSMGFGSLGYTKADYARTLAASLAYFLHRQRDATGLMTFDDAVVEYIPARYRPGHLRRLLISLERAVSGTDTGISEAMQLATNLVRKRGLMVVISDLLTPLDALRTQLSYLQSCRHDVIIFRILDPQEIQFNFDQEALFEDLESSKQIYVDPKSTQQHYIKLFDSHAATLKQICDDLGVELHTLSTDEPLEKALLEFVAGRSRKTSQQARRTTHRNRSAQNRREIAIQEKVNG